MKSLTENSKLSDNIEKSIEKLKALSRKSNLNFQNDIELIMQTEGLAIRQKPQYKINIENFEKIRKAIQKSIILNVTRQYTKI